jgi:hypothetical protein
VATSLVESPRTTGKGSFAPHCGKAINDDSEHISWLSVEGEGQYGYFDSEECLAAAIKQIDKQEALKMWRQFEKELAHEMAVRDFLDAKYSRDDQNN